MFLGGYLAFASLTARQKTEMKFGGMNFRTAPNLQPRASGMGIEGLWRILRRRVGLGSSPPPAWSLTRHRWQGAGRLEALS